MGSPGDHPEVLGRFNSELDLVEVVAKQIGRTLGRGVELDELLSFGREGLLDAARKFDAERGVPFRAYANFRVRGAILDGIRSLGRLPRRAHEKLRALQSGLLASEGALEDAFAPAPPGASSETAQHALDTHLATLATAMALGLIFERSPTGAEEDVADRAASPEEAVGRAELVDLVAQAVEDLPPPEDLLIRRHYFDGEQFDHVAADLGLSKSWASRLHTRAVARLAKRLRTANAR